MREMQKKCLKFWLETWTKQHFKIFSFIFLFFDDNMLINSEKTTSFWTRNAKCSGHDRKKMTPNFTKKHGFSMTSRN